jgi:hypothetical protein
MKDTANFLVLYRLITNQLLGLRLPVRLAPIHPVIRRAEASSTHPAASNHPMIPTRTRVGNRGAVDLLIPA